MLLAHMHVLRQQYKDTLEGIEGRGDREARGVLEGLLKEFRTVNEKQATLLGRMSKSNQILKDLLQKNEDGQASVVMARAIDTLVKVTSFSCLLCLLRPYDTTFWPHLGVTWSFMASHNASN